MVDLAPGVVALFGSGETSATGSKVFQKLAAGLPRPLRLAVLETPAGFELNSARVAGRVADFLAASLQNEKPVINVVAARRRLTPFSPDAPDIVAPLAEANLLFMGAGSPTYAVRQLQNSLAWQMVQARHALGAAVVLASAAAIAAGACALPVYEIYKAGAELHWQPGLNLLQPYGLALTIVPHWNNAEGGAELDTRCCFMGQSRFAELRAQLPAEMPVVGLDEHTALVFDLSGGQAQVIGRGGLTLDQGNEQKRWLSPATFALSELGNYRRPATLAEVPEAVWAKAGRPAAARAPAETVRELVAEREAARVRRDWRAADGLRAQINALGWQVKDTPAGPVIEPLAPA